MPRQEFQRAPSFVIGRPAQQQRNSPAISEPTFRCITQATKLKFSLRPLGVLLKPYELLPVTISKPPSLLPRPRRCSPTSTAGCATTKSQFPVALNTRIFAKLARGSFCFHGSQLGHQKFHYRARLFPTAFQAVVGALQRTQTGK